MQPAVDEEEWFSASFEKLSLAGSPAKGRRLSLGPARRLSSVQRPESHPVSPASSSGDGAGSPTAASPPPCKESNRQCGSHPTSAAISRFSIPAYCSNSATKGVEDQDAATPVAGGAAPVTPAPASASPALPAAERVTLNLFVQDTPQGQDVQQLQAELAGMRSCVDLLQGQLGEARQQVQHLEQAAGAAPTEQQAGVAESSGGVALVINVVDQQPARQQQHAAGITDLEQPDGACQPSQPNPTGQASLQQQLQRVETCREELTRQAGQLRGRIAKLEGAVLAGESRVRTQAAELEALKASSKELEQQLAVAQAQVGVTPDRARAERLRLVEQAAEAQAAAELHAAQAAQLAMALAFEIRQQREVTDFAALEHQLLSEQEQGLAADLAQWRTDAAAVAAQLAEMRQRLVDTDAVLLQRDDEVRQLRGELEAAQAATTAAAQLTAEWRYKAEQYDKDRQVAAANIRKAERELELVAQDNERMFRQLNFVRTRLMGQLDGLDPAVPDIGKLARELQSWCDREVVHRGRQKA